MFGWDSELQRTTILQYFCSRTVETVTDGGEGTVDTHLSDLQEVVMRCNPRGLHRDEAPHIRPGPDSCKAAIGEYLA